MLFRYSILPAELISRCGPLLTTLTITTATDLESGDERKKQFLTLPTLPLISFEAGIKRRQLSLDLLKVTQLFIDVSAEAI